MTAPHFDGAALLALIDAAVSLGSDATYNLCSHRRDAASAEQVMRLFACQRGLRLEEAVHSYAGMNDWINLELWFLCEIGTNQHVTLISTRDASEPARTHWTAEGIAAVESMCAALAGYRSPGWTNYRALDEQIARAA